MSKRKPMLPNVRDALPLIMLYEVDSELRAAEAVIRALDRWIATRHYTDVRRLLVARERLERARTP